MTKAQIRDLQNRELTPEDYELLLRLDEMNGLVHGQRQQVLSQGEAAALIETVLDGDAECSICLCDMASGEQEVLLACGHHYHPGCIKDWLVKGKDTCPMCNIKAKQ